MSIKIDTEITDIISWIEAKQAELDQLVLDDDPHACGEAEGYCKVLTYLQLQGDLNEV